MQAERQIAAPVRDIVARLPVAEWGPVHVIGLAGIGMRGLVNLFCERGLRVSGSELLDSPVLETLRRRGIVCRVGHASGNVGEGTNLVLISAAVNDSNPEVQAARTRRIPVLKYAECLGRLMSEKIGIAVAGTHGKTTTSSMVSLVLSRAGLDPTFVIGGEYPGLGGTSRWGGGPHFVAEACEYDRSFLNLRPQMSIVTNIEEEHLDYFRSLKEIKTAFADFVSRLPEDGYLVVNRDDPNSAYLSEFCRSSVATFSLGSRGADWWAKDLVPEKIGTRFRIVSKAGEEVAVSLPVPGRHNVANALAATAVCRHAGVSLDLIGEILSTFTGARRRFDVLHSGEVMVVDDYAHHPTEVLAVLRAARQSLPSRRLVAVFQPHQHSRLKNFRMRFADALARFDTVLVTDVFKARDCDEDIQTIHSGSLVAAVREIRPDFGVVHAPGFDDVLKALRKNVREGDVVFFLGAGDITNLARSYAEERAGSSA